MKTSKKILSFFLAVVMVVTTCSVGFSAFAAEKNKSIWSTDCEADDAYAAIGGLVDQYVPSLLMGILGENVEPIYKKYAGDYGTTADQLTDAQKEDIKTNKATVADILEALSPVIANVDLFGIKMSKADFMEQYKSVIGSGVPEDYNYLDTAEEGTIDFYTMYNLCAKTLNDSSANLSDEARTELEAWYEALSILAGKYREKINMLNGLTDLAVEIAKRSGAEKYSELSLAELKAIDFVFTHQEAQGDEMVTVDDTETAKEFVKYTIAQNDSRFAEGLIPESDSFNDQFAAALYYVVGMGENFIKVAPYDHLLELAEASIDLVDAQYDFTIDGSTEKVMCNATGLTAANAAEKLGDAVLAAFGLEDNAINRSKVEAAIVKTYCDKIILPANTPVESSYYFDYIKGATVLSGAYTADGYDKAYAAIKQSDTVLTQTQLRNLGNEIKKICYVTGSGWDNEKLKTYLTDPTTSFASYYGGTAIADFALYYVERGETQDLLELLFGASAYTKGTIMPVPASIVKYNAFLAAAPNFSRIKLANDAFDGKYAEKNKKLECVDVFRLNDISDTAGYRNGYIRDYADAHLDYNVSVELEENEKYKASDYDLASPVGVEIVNTMINNTIGGFLPAVESIFVAMPTKLDVDTAFTDIYKRAYDNVTKTVFELLPIIVAILEEGILPGILNNPDVIENRPTQQLQLTIEALITPMLVNLIGGDDFKLGTKISYNAAPGFTTMTFDLNTLLPNVLHWLYEGDAAADKLGFIYYKDYTESGFDGTDKPVPLKNGANIREFIINSDDDFTLFSLDHLKNYTALDQDGYEISYDGEKITYRNNSYSDLDAVAADYPDAVFNYYSTFKGDVPRLTGIYVLDELLSGLSIKDISVMIGLLIGGDAGKAVGEAVTEIITLLMVAVDEFLADPELADAAKVDEDGGVICKGLNNIFVALPQLFDIIENLAADKYGVDKDAWVYCYEGKIERDGNAVYNTLLERFKSYASSDDPNRSIDILDCFAEALIENWLDAILSLLNTVVSTDNEIANNLPIVVGILNSVGGFGEQSILTDIVNSVFQLTRDSEYSFTFSTNHSNPNNNLTGLSKQNAYFLLANIDRLTEVITNLIAHFGGNGDNGDNNDSSDDIVDNSPSPVIKLKPAANAAATSHNYSANDLSNTKDLIGNLDKMLSSLLSDSTINDFSLNSTENLIAGIVSLLDRFLGNDIDLGNDLATDIAILVNQYLYFVTGESDNLTADGKKVNPKKVYTNDALTGLVVETYALIEKIADRLLNHKDGLVDLSDEYDIGNNNKTRYNLIVEAIDGIIAPDAISVRLGDYGNAQDKFAETKYTTWTDMSEASSRNNYSNLRVDWGFRDGNKEGFYDGLAASLRLVTSILGVLFIETGWYNTVLTPILGALCDKNGIELESYETLKADAEATGYYDKTFLAIITPVSEWLTALLNAPASTLIKSIQGLAGFIDDNNTKAGTIKSVIDGVVAPIKNELKGAGKIFAIESDKLLPTSLTLQSILNDLADSINIKPEINGCEINGANIIPLVNTLLANTGIQLKQISWSKIYSSTPEAALVYVLEYVIENLLDDNNLSVISKLLNNDILTIIIDALKSEKITAVDILGLINNVLEITDTPTLAYWTFAQYLQELTENFRYPAGITKAMADQGVETLDNLVKNIFPLLGSFGVNLGADDLKGIIDSNLFKNELLTKFAVTLYSALDGLDPTIKTVLKGLGIVTSTKDVAKLLTDSSYGTTFSSAANTIKAQSSWSNVKNVNWGFTDGSAKAQQGFVNAFVAILRPLNDVLNVFLNEGALHLDEVAYEAITSITVAPTTQNIEVAGNIVIGMTISMSNGVVTIKIDDAVREKSAASTIKLDLRSLKNLNDLKIEGTNGYNSAIIPLLEALQCKDVKTYNQYRSDVNSAKDNLLLDILNPIAGASSNSLLNRLADKPFAVLTNLIPNLAMYLDAQGPVLLVSNLLAPITGILGDTQDFAALANQLIELLLGDSLENAIIPLVNGILADKNINIKLPNINWNALISLGTKMSYTSAATGADGKYLTGKMVGNIDQGKVLITVLRYIAQVLTDNSSSLKSLILGIDKLKNNKNYDMIASILTSVFNTIGTASADQIVVAIFYLVSSEPTNAFWDYTKYKTGQYSFAYPETVDVDFLKNLPPMLDGLIGGLLDLNGLISENLFTDSLVSKLAKGLYGAVEGVKINDGMNLTELLAQTDIDFSTTNVANLLVNKDYGQTFESAASVIRNAGSWKNVNADALKWGVTDRDSFFHALVAVLRPIYGVLDVLLNDADLGLFNLIRIPGSNGYTSSIVPLMEAFSMYNIKTQYQYREDINKEYDAILLDIINPIWDKVEDILNAPIQTLMAVVPNLALFIGNDGLCQIIDNLLTPVSALVDALRPIVDLNDLLGALLPALGVNLNSLLGKIGITNFKLDIYDLNKTLKQVLGGDAIIPLVNNILGIIKIKGTPLGLKLNAVDWLQLASHGTTIVSASQAATYGSRIFVEGDSSETLIAFLRYLINTINAGDNFDKISSLIGGLLGDNVADNVSDIISQVLGMLQGDTDEVISSLVELLQTLA